MVNMIKLELAWKWPGMIAWVFLVLNWKTCSERLGSGLLSSVAGWLLAFLSADLFACFGPLLALWPLDRISLTYCRHSLLTQVSLPHHHLYGWVFLARKPQFFGLSLPLFASVEHWQSPEPLRNPKTPSCSEDDAELYEQTNSGVSDLCIRIFQNDLL